MTSSHPAAQPLSHLRNMLSTGKMPGVLRDIARTGDITVSCLLDNQALTFSSSQDDSFTATTRLEIGCVAKTLTATLVAIAASEGRLSIADDVARFFPQSRCIDSSLKILHLLNQSHGLDGSILPAAPRSEGYIDAETVWNAVQETPALAPPGELFYNYGSAGIWIAAAILQKIYDAPFWRVLYQKLLTPIGVPLSEKEGIGICPANGGIALSPQELLNICSLHLARHHDSRLKAILAEARTYRISIPSWPPIAHGSCPGWLCHGPAFGSFGNRHNVASIMMLIWPEQDVALVMSARRVRPIYLAQRALFGNLFDSEKETPRPLTKLERDLHRRQSFIGQYQKGGLLLDIHTAPDGELQASVYRRRADGTVDDAPMVCRNLLPAMSDTLYPVPPEPNVISFLRFFQETEERQFLYATTGKHLFRRK